MSLLTEHHCSHNLIVLFTEILAFLFISSSNSSLCSSPFCFLTSSFLPSGSFVCIAKERGSGQKFFTHQRTRGIVGAGPDQRNATNYIIHKIAPHKQTLQPVFKDFKSIALLKMSRVEKVCSPPSRSWFAKNPCNVIKYFPRRKETVISYD